MKVEEVSNSLIGRRVSCIENGARVTGHVIGVREDQYNVYVKVMFDKPLECWSGDYNIESWIETEYESWARKYDGWGNLQYMYLIDTLDWLNDYKPKNEHFTDKFEMQEIADNLGLEYMSNEQIQKKRDEVVMFYHKLVENAIMAGDQEKRWDLSDGLMSVTAVIDHYKYNRGMEV